jgi:hypothetical protein
MWNEVVIKDVTNPFVYSDEKRQQNKLEYENRWNNFLKNNNLSQGCNNANEMLVYKDEQTCPKSFSKFILKRDQFVKDQLMGLVLEDKFLYIKERIYSMTRLFFTGINIYEVNPDESMVKQLMRIYPFVITVLSIFIGFFISIIFLRKSESEEVRYFVPMMMIILYVAGSHAIFPIQARYLVPMHLLVLIMLSINFSKLFKAQSLKR